MNKKIIVGLGNPGARYSKTRHNLGFMVIDELAGRLEAGSWSRTNRSRVAATVFHNSRVILAKPQTYMNLSGQAVQSLMTTHKIPIGDLLVVVDDLALPFGKIRFRPSGSHGGHKGLISIIETLGNRNFPRLRIGIGHAPDYMDTSDYVLARFTEFEKKALPSLISACADGVITFLENDINQSMNEFNNTEIEIPSVIQNKPRRADQPQGML
ncbi:MAG: aminoacyl-tRNA hydrolase [Vulcanimicrobiota bacterium]